MLEQDTIAAIATATGAGGIGIVRLSGKLVLPIAEQITQRQLKPRFAHYANFYNQNKELLDSGIALYFAAPNSFTGEDCVELQGHGGQIVLQMVLDACLQLGARLASPGEFSYRAFLNNKLDLTQAEAIADLISASSQTAARNALHSLRGDFSHKITQLNNELIQLRVLIEASLDFPEEEIDFLDEHNIATQISTLIAQIDAILQAAAQGVIVQNGMRIVLGGAPNAGKSSLLNALAGYDAAIVTDIAGTTRDILREQIQIDGLLLHLIDTAGLREANNEIEQIGISKAKENFASCDHILLVVDSSSAYDLAALKQNFPANIPLTVVFNKIDLSNKSAKITQQTNNTEIYLSAKTGAGLDLLRNHLKQSAGFMGVSESSFSARKRHVIALRQAKEDLKNAQKQVMSELLAEDLRRASQNLAEITGQFTTDDLLEIIFSSFCIGK